MASLEEPEWILCSGAQNCWGTLMERRHAPMPGSRGGWSDDVRALVLHGKKWGWGGNVPLQSPILHQVVVARALWRSGAALIPPGLRKGAMNSNLCLEKRQAVGKS